MERHTLKFEQARKTDAFCASVQHIISIEQDKEWYRKFQNDKIRSFLNKTHEDSRAIV